MEVDGRKLRKSLYQGSDNVHDFLCSPCEKEGKNVAAAKHCVECDENLCTTCLNHHNKFSAMKGHQLLNKVKTPSGQRPELPSQRCDRHGGKLIDVYCPSHDKVGCSTCIAVEHSTCQGISFIPDVAKHSRSSEELQQLETALSSLESRFIALKQKKQKELDCSKREKDKLIHEIKSERKKINDQLDKMEMELLNEVDALFTMKLQNIDSDIKEVEGTLSSLGKYRQKIQAAKSENVSEKYVQVKLGHEREKIAIDSLESLERSKKIGALWFDPNRHITGSKTNIVGQLICYPAVEVGKFIGEFDASVSNDDTCSLYDMCLCVNESIVMTDYNNKKIKKMNESYSVTSFLTVKDNPFGICQIDASLLAVTLVNMKEVQFISQREPMTLQKSFNVGDRCRGIAYNDGLIYVCCGGSSDRKKNEGTGRIEVYTIDGALMKSYNGETGCPFFLTVPSWRKEIYVSDSYGDVHIIHKEGNQRVAVKKDTKLDEPSGFCWINRSQVCIAGFASKNLVLMSSDGRMYEELLTVKDGITNTLSVCFDEKQSRLVVSSFNIDKIKVYSLKISKC